MSVSNRQARSIARARGGAIHSVLAAGIALLAAACGGGGGDGGVTTAPPDDPARGQTGAPVFENEPAASADHNRPWVFDVRVSDPDGDEVAVSVVRRPGWMEFDPSRLRLSGIAGWNNVGTHRFTLRASDGGRSTTREFAVDVVKGEIVCDQDFGDPGQSEYALPFPEGRTYRLIQTYCPPNPNWGHHDWFAYDFDTAIGDTIVASRGGRVTAVVERFADGTRVCGEENLVYVLHADGTRMAYVHLTTNGVLVDVGDLVEPGQPIALSGDSGCSTGPHVHVALFRPNPDFTRKSSLPLNYRNAIGPLDENRGLVQDASYEAASVD